MEVVFGIVVAAVIMLCAVPLVFMGRKRRKERREVEDMFAPDRRDNLWWEERH